MSVRNTNRAEIENTSGRLSSVLALSDAVKTSNTAISVSDTPIAQRWERPVLRDTAYYLDKKEEKESIGHGQYLLIESGGRHVVKELLLPPIGDSVELSRIKVFFDNVGGQHVNRVVSSELNGMSKDSVHIEFKTFAACLRQLTQYERALIVRKFMPVTYAKWHAQHHKAASVGQDAGGHDQHDDHMSFVSWILVGVVGGGMGVLASIAEQAAEDAAENYPRVRQTVATGIAEVFDASKAERTPEGTPKTPIPPLPTPGYNTDYEDSDAIASVMICSFLLVCLLTIYFFISSFSTRRRTQGQDTDQNVYGHFMDFAQGN